MNQDDAHEARLRLGRLVEEARLRADPPLSKRDVGRSVETYDRIVNGMPVRDATLYRAARALGWAPEAVDEILAGSEVPRPATAETPTEPDVVYAFEEAGAVFDGIAGLTDEERAEVLATLRRGLERIRARNRQ